jgi:hypothetical protein
VVGPGEFLGVDETEQDAIELWFACALLNLSTLRVAPLEALLFVTFVAFKDFPESFHGERLN